MNEAAQELPGEADDSLIGFKADERAKPRALPDNALDGFRNGAILDLRVRFAMELLTRSPMFRDLDGTQPIDDPQVQIPKAAAKFALDVATELFALAEARGLIEDFDTPGDKARLKAHIARQTTYALEQQREALRQQEQQVAVGAHVHRAFNPKPN